MWNMGLDYSSVLSLLGRLGFSITYTKWGVSEDGDVELGTRRTDTIVKGVGVEKRELYLHANNLDDLSCLANAIGIHLAKGHAADLPLFHVAIDDAKGLNILGLCGSSRHFPHIDFALVSDEIEAIFDGLTSIFGAIVDSQR